MKYNQLRKTTRLLMIISVLAMFIGSVQALIPIGETYTVESVDINPDEPVRQGEVTFTATISGEGISKVYLLVQECNDEICYFVGSFNETMTSDDVSTYEATITLVKDDATYFKYAFGIVTDEGWEQSDFTNVDLTIDNGNDNNNNGNNEGDNGNNNNTPGFEFVFFICAIGVVTVLAFRRRYQ